MVKCFDWDLLYCLRPNELLCQDTDKCGSFRGETDLEHTWMAFQGIQQL